MKNMEQNLFKKPINELSIETNTNPYIEKINKIEQEYLNQRLFPLGKIREIIYANQGKTLIIECSGDVPTNFEPIHIVIVHQDSENDGVFGKGHIGFNTIGGPGVNIGTIPLPKETVEIIKTIYQDYTNQRPNFQFESIDTQGDVTRFAFPGMYQDIIEKYNSQNRKTTS